MYEKLVKMQHYQIPTRIMDITGNSLAALYFACENNFKQDGAVFLFTSNTENTSYPDSDKVRILSNLSRLSDYKYCDYTFTNHHTYNYVAYNKVAELFYKYIYCVLIDNEDYNNIIINREVIEKIDSEIINSNVKLSNLEYNVSYIYQVFIKYMNKNTRRAEFSDSMIATHKLFFAKVNANKNCNSTVDINKINSADTILNDVYRQCH